MEVRLQSMSTWYEDLGFAENPFFLDPVPADIDTMENVFVNRDRERETIAKFAQERRGKLIVFGRTGEGKSSLLNFLEYQAKLQNKGVIKVDGTKLTDKEAFVEELLHQIELKTEALSNDAKKKLKEKMEDLAIIELRKTETAKQAYGVEAKLRALIVSIAGKAEVEEGKGEEKTYYITPRMTKLERIVSELIPAVLEDMPTVIIADNLEKSSQGQFRTFLTDVSGLVPGNALFITTGIVTETDSETMHKCYDIFNTVLLMDPLDSAEKLKEFIERRIEGHCKNGHKPPALGQGVIELLLDRANGNLRETFRYCYCAFQKFGRRVSDATMLKAMQEVDAPRFAVMSEPELRTLSILAEGSDNTVKKVAEALSETEGKVEIETTRSRLEKLVDQGFASKKKVRITGRAYESVYAVPKTVKTILDRWKP
jgi:hypothetical protein